jgi:hypothetical protein
MTSHQAQDTVSLNTFSDRKMWIIWAMRPVRNCAQKITFNRPRSFSPSRVCVEEPSSGKEQLSDISINVLLASHCFSHFNNFHLISVDKKTIKYKNDKKKNLVPWKCVKLYAENCIAKTGRVEFWIFLMVICWRFNRGDWWILWKVCRMFWWIWHKIDTNCRQFLQQFHHTSRLNPPTSLKPQLKASQTLLHQQFPR